MGLDLAGNVCDGSFTIAALLTTTVLLTFHAHKTTHAPTQELERRRIDAIRIATYMDVMGAVKKGEPHPRIAMAARAHSVKEVERLTHGMLYRKLGKSDLVVSEVCLGTMTWGEQCTEEQAHAQLDMAVDEYGVNFVVRACVGVFLVFACWRAHSAV